MRCFGCRGVSEMQDWLLSIRVLFMSEKLVCVPSGLSRCRLTWLATPIQPSVLHLRLFTSTIPFSFCVDRTDGPFHPRDRKMAWCYIRRLHNSRYRPFLASCVMRSERSSHPRDQSLLGWCRHLSRTKADRHLPFLGTCVASTVCASPL